MVKCLPTMQETGVQSLSQEDPLEKEMATHSSILAWKIHGWRSLVGIRLSDFTSSLASSSRRTDQDRGELVRQGSALQELLERPTA